MRRLATLGLILSLSACATVSRYRPLTAQDTDPAPAANAQTFGFWGLVGINEPGHCPEAHPTLVSTETRISPLSFLFLGLIGWTETRVQCR